MNALVGLCGMVALAGPPLVGEGPGAGLALVDRLAWAAPERDVVRWVGNSSHADSVFSRAIRPGQESEIRALRSPTLYAVEAQLLEDGLFLRQAVAYTNRGRQPLRTLVFRVFAGGEVSRAALLGAYVDGVAARASLDESLLRVELPAPLRPGEVARVLIEVAEAVPEFSPSRGVFDGERFTLADTGAYGRSGTIVNLGFWLPLITPRGPDGRFDERPLPKMGEHVYFEPAHFYVSLDLPRDHVVASTGVELERVESGDRARVVMVASAVRDFAMNLSPDFAITEGEVDGLRVRIFHDPERPAIGRDLLSYALDSASWMDRELGRLSAAELDVVDAPARLVLGQEFPGLVTIDTHHDTGVYVRSDDHAWTLAHEVAHQWWFSEVGNDAAASPWLDEALASHSAALFWEEAHGRESLDRWLQSEVFDAYELLTAAGVPDRPANLPGDAYNIVQYGAVIYGKAVMFYEALREAVGQDAHRAALRRLYREHRLDFLEDEDVLRVWSRASADSGSVQVLFDRWIAGAHGSSDLVRPEASSE